MKEDKIKDIEQVKLHITYPLCANTLNSNAAAQYCDTKVAQAAPTIPFPNNEHNTKSREKFTAAARSTEYIGFLAMEGRIIWS